MRGIFMLHLVTVETMEALIQKETPFVRAEDLRAQAEAYVRDLDERLDEPLARYAKDGTRTNLHHGEFSLLSICALRRGCGYLEAAVLMDGYMKDELYGKARILRR
jgi:hypothetical protein